MPRKVTVHLDEKFRLIASYPSDRVEVTVGRDSRKVELHVGERRAGERRYVLLTAGEARRLARELLGAAGAVENKSAR